MADDTDQSDSSSSGNQHDATRKQIRGSSMLLLGRCMALAINLAVQVVTVRYLTKEAFGSFAFGISMVALGANLSVFGLNKTLTRFLPIYQERGERSKMAGAMALMIGTVAGLAVATVALVYGLQSVIGNHVTSDAASLSLLLVLIVLVPVDSLNLMLESLFAVFGKVRLIFFRRYVLGPGLKLVAVLSVVVFEGDVRQLAFLYVTAGVAGVLYYMFLLGKILRDEGMLRFFRVGAWELPAGEIYRFSLPLISSQIGFVVKTSAVVLLLEMMTDSSQVAEFRAVFPFARLNEVVLISFSLLFTPLAARQFSRGNFEGIQDLYWRTSVWITIFSLPAFLITGVLSRPLTVLMLGERYADAGLVLGILATGYFINSVMGFNVHTLRVFAKIRQIVVIDLIAIGVSIVLCALLIPQWGAIGGACAICATTLVQNVLFQFAMRFTTGVGAMDRRYVRFYLTTVAVIACLSLAQWVWNGPLALGVPLAAIAFCGLLLQSRSLLDVQGTFPEVLKVPIIGRLLAGPEKTPWAGAREGSR